MEPETLCWVPDKLLECGGRLASFRAWRSTGSCYDIHLLECLFVFAAVLKEQQRGEADATLSCVWLMRRRMDLRAGRLPTQRLHDSVSATDRKDRKMMQVLFVS
ncbi:hypothetical protein EYF80_038349 [Liparis tanakae]|uniref:Uncharacterized protein n=1 Tax=Liparis tanakae TaxID=230148 RepID=A0A4Z2GCZ6_9TELE|nr:hypothetical protein EYF80_038349 [Liparis tanakae]